MERGSEGLFELDGGLCVRLGPLHMALNWIDGELDDATDSSTILGARAIP